MDPLLPMSRPLRILVLRLVHQGIRGAGEFGWTAEDWAHAAAVPAEVLHAALEGRLLDEPGCLRLLAALGVQLQRAAGTDDGVEITVQLPLPLAGAGSRSAAPLLTIACQHCQRRGELQHQRGVDGTWQLRCAACQVTRPFAASALAQHLPAPASPA